MRYSVLVKRPDGGEVGSLVVAYEDAAANEMAKTLAESYGQGSTVLSIVDTEGRDVMTEQKDPLERESQRPDKQNKTAEERVEKQEISTKEVVPDKTGDIRPNR